MWLCMHVSIYVVSTYVYVYVAMYVTMCVCEASH